MMMTPRAKPRQRVQLNSHKDITAAHEDQSELIQVARIRTDGGTQMRAAIDKSVVREYAALMADGHEFPPIVVYHDGTNYWLADGFHRLRAWELYHKDKGEQVESIACDVKSGDRRRAILHAVKANAEHGLRRTNADKRRAVEVLLRDKEWQHWSDREIAKACGVSHPLVGKMREELRGPTGNDYQSAERIGADGRTINTARIGTNQPKRAQSQRREIKPVRDERPPREPVAPTPPTYTQEPDPQPQPEPMQPGPVQTQFDADLQAYGYTIVCLGPDRYQWRTAGDSETGIGFGSGPVYATVYEALQDAMDKIAKQQAYERAQAGAEYLAQQAARIPEVARKAARLHNVSEVCELMLDSLTDYEQDTGDYGGSHEVRKWMRHMRETIQRHLDAYGGK